MLAHWLPLLAGILISGCSWNRIVEAPALPEPKAEQFSPAVRDRLQGAYQAALAHPSDAGAVGRYGMVLQAHGQRESALSCYRSAQALAPGTFEWPYYLGVAAAELGDHHAASSAFEQALKLRPGYLPARLRYADAVLESGGVSRSLELYQSIVQDYPTLATPLYGLGQAQERSGRTKQAAESLQKALDLYPDYSAAQYALAMVYRRLGDTQASNRLMERYESSGKTAPPIEDPVLGAMRGLDASAQAHLRRSLELAAAGRLEEAAKANLAALEINPKLVRAHVNLISLYGRLGREEEAARHYHSAIEIQPGSPESHYNFGVMLVSAGRVDEARTAFQKAIKANPRHAEAHNNLGYLLEQNGRTTEAMKHYSIAIENKPNYRLAHYHMGRLLVKEGKPREAISHLQKTLTPEDEDTPGYMYGLAIAYIRSGDTANGLKYARKARDLAASMEQVDLRKRLDHEVAALEKRAR